MNTEEHQLRLAGDAAESNATIVRPTGEINFDTSPALRADLLALADRQPSRVVIDCGNVTHIDSSGVGTLVEFKRTIERLPGGELILAAIQPDVRGVFEVSQLDKFFTIVGTVQDAIAHVKNARRPKKTRKRHDTAQPTAPTHES